MWQKYTNVIIIRVQNFTDGIENLSTVEYTPVCKQPGIFAILVQAPSALCVVKLIVPKAMHVLLTTANGGNSVHQL